MPDSPDSGDRSGAADRAAPTAAPAAAAASAALPRSSGVLPALLAADAAQQHSRCDLQRQAASSSAGVFNSLTTAPTVVSSVSQWRPSPADFSSSPVLLAAHPRLQYQTIRAENPMCLPINSGTPFEFETPLFSGRACVWIRGLPATPAADALFAGRQRRSLVTVQGRFRQPVPVDDLVTGQEFGPLKGLPPSWLLSVLFKAARALNPSIAFGPLSAPSMLMPVVAACNEMHAALPGAEPDPAGPPCEDLRAWDPALALPDGSPLPAPKRKHFFCRASNRAGRCFPTDLVFTFYFYQHVLDLASYELCMPLHRFRLPHHLCGQPLQLMMRQRSSGEYAYCFQLWHAGLLEH